MLIAAFASVQSARSLGEAPVTQTWTYDLDDGEDRVSWPPSRVALRNELVSQPLSRPPGWGASRSNAEARLPHSGQVNRRVARQLTNSARAVRTETTINDTPRFFDRQTAVQPARPAAGRLLRQPATPPRPKRSAANPSSAIPRRPLGLVFREDQRQIRLRECLGHNRPNPPYHRHELDRSRSCLAPAVRSDPARASLTTVSLLP